ncbi:MAG: hypothetical protein WEA61_03270 [Anaerolineales bacterium]
MNAAFGIRSDYSLGVLSVLVGMGVSFIVMRMMSWSEAAQELWFMILAFAFSIPLDKLFHVVLYKLIGKTEL